MRRARPLLGTLVVIDVDGDDERAGDAAFARIAGVHAAMSFHEADSDLRALARSGAGDVLHVRSDTHAVLRFAARLESTSNGAFNASCAALLVEHGRLPAPGDALAPRATSLADGIELLDDDRVRVLRTPWIDLGGIAKGYAVDAAVRTLESNGVRAGIVNAGGDLRAFGSARHTVHLRDPRAPMKALPLAELTDMACATSAGDAAHVVGPRSDNAPMSVTVFAPTCTVADALTKVVWLQGAASAALLCAHDAQAFVMHADGTTQGL